jgi:cytochrome P450
MVATSAMRAHEEAYSTSLKSLDMSDAKRFQSNTAHAYFERLRREAPVHYCPKSPFGAYWSITKYQDIMATDTNHKVFSSEGGITLAEAPTADLKLQTFIAMDPPKHDEQRKAVSPIVAPANPANLEGLIRSRAIAIIEGLPVDETFNWVERVSVELTTQMLATLFDFPFEERRLLTYWSDIASAVPVTPEEWERRDTEIQKCLA